ncbi:MAG: hypothetical protein K2O18_03095, partial [Oscillospiraceae bacterium]|nr:hypothetical protein [Oscillospiraceae bacterium]
RSFYRENPSAPYAERVIERIDASLNVKRLKQSRLEDEQAPADVPLNLKNRPFFRHWLNTAFSTACGRSQSLLRYLNQELPCLPQWSRRFLETEEGDIAAPKTLTCELDGDAIEIRFHLYYIDFLLNGAPVYRPFLDWDRLCTVEDTDIFCFLLPVTVSACARYEEVKAELRRRLQDTAAPDPDLIASGLAGQICCLELENTCLSAIFPMEFFAEDTEHLYGCAWYEKEQCLRVFMLDTCSEQIFSKGIYEDVYDIQSAVSLGQQLLSELVSPTAFPMELLQNLPEEVFIDPDYTVPGRDGILSNAAIPRWLLREEITSQELEKLLELFSDGRLKRLEFSWPSAIPAGEEQACGAWRSLVFLKEQAGYACLYFDDFRAQSYALLARPELYGQAKGVSFVPFRDGKLFEQDVHKSFASIRRQLPVIFRQVSWPNNVKYMAGRIWDYAVNVTHGRHKYNLDKQLLGGFPAERVYNNPDARFYFPDYPNMAVWPGGALEVGELNRERLQQLLIQFLNGGFSKLRLTWGKKTGTRWHIVLLEDRGRFMMVWLDESRKKAEYHVADRWTYMDVEGKKYPKDVFQGRTVPAYLIHGGVIPLRSALEQLLANLPDPYSVTGKFAEYAAEKPVKARSYDDIWTELAGDNAISPG